MNADMARIADTFRIRVHVTEALPPDTLILYSPPAPDDRNPATSLPRRAMLIRNVGSRP